MTLRRRLAVVSAAAVAVAIALASVVVYFVVRGELRGQVDDQLRGRSGDVMTVAIRVPEGEEALPEEPDESLEPVPPGADVTRSRSRDGRKTVTFRRRVVLPEGALGGPAFYAQIVSSDGRVERPPGTDVRLPGVEVAREIAAGRRGPEMTDATVDGTHVRMYTRRVAPGEAVQAARSLEEVDDTLNRLAIVLAAVTLAGIALAALLGRLVARAALTPVSRLTTAAEDVALTRDLSRRVEATGQDELARLARSYNAMLAALESSLAAQRQLVADASHELRTPLTSLRTNIEVLARAQGMTPAERERLLGDVTAQLAELTALVGDLVDLARDEADRGEPAVDLRLDELAADAVDRARMHHPQCRFSLDAERCVVRGAPDRLERALANLLDNAAKWTPPGGEVEVTVRADGEVVVRDHGPGFAEDDLPHVFDRFYRAASARGMAGSGLGLAIVRQVAEAHGGAVRAGNAPGGGALLTLTLPAVREAAASPA